MPTLTSFRKENTAHSRVSKAKFHPFTSPRTVSRISGQAVNLSIHTALMMLRF
ncbi:hypothetical protein SAMN05444412_11281 [Rhodonellum ikkaensis]|uniref:Uncharacterized protein n=1 Tax=Rhodonellum ikkaensis TaxID=336829 RepID=A0A1H3SML3_9BACT|nr:hypothetical protein SAMN05444412_11281 [Rhodonellum ikkaensis]